MEHSFDLLIKEKERIQTEIEQYSALINNHYKHIERLKKEQIRYEIKRREVNQTIDLIKHNNMFLKL